MKYSNKKAFTLIELLIAMFIFVIIATFLIPQVSKDAEKQLFTTQLLKVHSDLQQAFLVMITRNQGALTGYCAGGTQSQCIVGEAGGIGKYLEHNVIFKYDSAEDVKNATKSPKKQAAAYKARDPKFIDKKTSASYGVNDSDSFQAIYLKNGAYVSAVYISTCDKTEPDTTVKSSKAVCGYLEVDVNAAKAPNMVGKDIHYFWIHPRDGLIPFGDELDAYDCGGGNGDNKSAKTANDKTYILGCTARVFEDKKIDYY